MTLCRENESTFKVSTHFKKGLRNLFSRSFQLLPQGDAVITYEDKSTAQSAVAIYNGMCTKICSYQLRVHVVCLHVCLAPVAVAQVNKPSVTGTPMSHVLLWQ